MEQNRANWVDVGKGLGILAVVLGHNPLLKSPELSDLHSFLFLFHMPLFFFLSGVVHRRSTTNQYLARKFRTILVPYLFASVVFVVVAAKGVIAEIGVRALSVVYGIGDLMPQPHLWFLPVLFLTGLLFNSIQLALGMEGRWRRSAALVALSFVSVLFVCISPRYSVHSGGVHYAASLLSIDLVPISILYYAVGHVYMASLDREFERYSGSAGAWLYVIVVVGMLWYCAISDKVALDLNLRIYSFAAALVALAGVLAVVVLAKSRPFVQCGWLAALGRRSLIIFIFHYFIQSRLAARVDGPLGGILGFALAVLLPFYLDILLTRLRVWSWIFHPSRPRGTISIGSPRSAR